MMKAIVLAFGNFFNVFKLSHSSHFNLIKRWKIIKKKSNKANKKKWLTLYAAGAQIFEETSVLGLSRKVEEIITSMLMILYSPLESGKGGK